MAEPQTGPVTIEQPIVVDRLERLLMAPTSDPYCPLCTNRVSDFGRYARRPGRPAVDLLEALDGEWKTITTTKEAPMYAVVGQVKVDIARESEARKLLEEFTVPSAEGLDGFNNGYWARALDGDQGHSLLLFDTEANARAAAERIAQGPPPGAPVAFTSVSVCEVVAQT